MVFGIKVSSSQRRKFAAKRQRKKLLKTQFQGGTIVGFKPVLTVWKGEKGDLVLVKATFEKQEKNKVTLEVEVSAEEFEKAVDEAYRKLAPQIAIPGFRKGKAPRKLIESRYGKEVFYDEALEILVPKAYGEALDQTGIEPIDQPRIDIVSLEDGKPFVFKAEVEVMPEVQLGEYKGLEVTKHLYTVDEHDIEHNLEHLREQAAELVAVEDRDTVQEGDFVTLDFTGYVDGEPFPGGAAEGYLLEIGSGSFIPGFESQLVGLKVGEDAEINVTFPENYGNKDLAGKAAMFKVKIHEIKVKKLPELDDEFAKDVDEEVESLEQLKAKIRERLEEQAAQRSTSEMRSELVRLATENASVEVPQVLVEREAESMVQEFGQMLLYQGMWLERYLEMTNQTEDQLKQSFYPEAETRVKNSLVLEAIGKAENITVSDEEVDAKIEEYVKASAKPEETRKVWEGRRESLRDNLAVSKVIDFLADHAKIDEVEVSHDHAEEESGTEVEAEVDPE